MALNGLFCADVPLRNYSLTHDLLYHDECWRFTKSHIMQNGLGF